MTDSSSHFAQQKCFKRKEGKGVILPEICFPIVFLHQVNKMVKTNQVIIAQCLAWRLATGEVQSSNPGKGENY